MAKKQATISRISILRSPYALLSLAVLTSTTLLWSLLGMRLHSSNADQLINSYLFQDLATFNNSLLPGAHTFLLKWPLFLFLRIFDHSSVALGILTIFASSLTVGSLAYMIYRIEHRPQRFAALILMLSTILLFIPAQPYAGGLLPVNFAMLTTRNLEYIVYIISLILIVRTQKLQSWQLFGATALMSVLVASDRLFLFFSFGGAICMLGIYSLMRKPDYAQLALRWLAVSICSGIIAVIVLSLMTTSGLTNIVGQGDTGPYDFIHSIKQLSLGIVFATTGMLTNFGANPIFDIGILKDIPSVLWSRLFSLSTIGFLTNGVVFVAGLFACRNILFASFLPSKQKTKKSFISTAAALSIMLIFSSCIALVIFMATDHYYAVDARYLTITFFALFIALTTYQRTVVFPSSRDVFRILLGLLFVSIVAGCFWTIQTYQKQSAAFTTINHRNEQVATLVSKRKTDILIGDYWRVIPIANKSSVTVLPLQSCTTTRNTLTSTHWGEDLKTRSFSYLLSLDKSLTDYPNCSIDEIVKFYGPPNASTIVAGTNDNPTELLLFYDQGMTKNHHALKTASHYSTILPIKPSEIASNNKACKDLPSIMNIVAHQDDDLLFMNPTLSHHIDNGHCVRTIYITAGDAGQKSSYWLDRERGSRAAYASLLGIDQNTPWIERTIKLSDNQFITETSPSGNSKVSLLFMRLTDGNLAGEGFHDSKYESLNQLIQNNISTIHTVDNTSKYTSDQLSEALLQLMKSYTPTEVNAMAMEDFGTLYHDHSDHLASGFYAERAHYTYNSEVLTPINYYIGYPVREWPENVTDTALEEKITAFIKYSRYDNSVCKSIDACIQADTYWSYLHREYTAN